jgi:hypothetical protein
VTYPIERKRSSELFIPDSNKRRRSSSEPPSPTGNIKKKPSLLNCAICRESLDPDSSLELKTLQCLHIFHRSCIEPWLARSASCPLCRRASDFSGRIAVLMAPLEGSSEDRTREMINRLRQYLIELSGLQEAEQNAFIEQLLAALFERLGAPRLN